MGKNFTVEFRKDCAICGADLPAGSRSYCSTPCRNKRNYLVSREYQSQWQKDKRGEFVEGKLQCLLCDNWYVQIGQHVIQTHKQALIEYKDDNLIPRGYGIIPAWLKEIKSKMVFENETVKNLEKGARFRYIKNDPRAKMAAGQKGKLKGRKYTMGYAKGNSGQTKMGGSTQFDI